jgi:predicted transcriptional regulator
MLSIMLEKGLVKRTENVRPHVYRPAISREKAGKKMLKDLIHKVYEGSTMSLVVQALSSTPASPEERDELRRLLDQMDREGKR